MAGHSKWANIKHRKGAQDAKRGKLFSKLIKEITVSVKEGGADPDSNPRLRLAIQNAKGKNVPKDNIERAINKGTGDDVGDYVDLTYEGYAPNGVAVFVECSTDNLNRTIADVRAVFNKNGGSLGKNGCVEYLFDRKAVFTFDFPEGADKDDLTLELIDGGAEEIEFEGEIVHVTADMEDFGMLSSKLDELKIEAKEAGLQRIPNVSVQNLADEDFNQVMKLIDKLEDCDDVQQVYHNLEPTDAQMEMV